MIAGLLFAKALLLPLALAAGLAFVWNLKHSVEAGAAAQAELEVQGRYREQEARVREAQGKRHDREREAQAATEKLLRVELDTLKGHAAPECDCGWGE